MKKYLVVLITLSLISLWPFFKKGYFESHDGEWMIIRFSAFHQTFASGQFPVRFVDRLNNNYGYPVLNFLYPLPFYLSEIPKLLGFGFVNSVKVVFTAATVASVLAMFWALLQIFSPQASFAGAIVYLFIPYRFVDLYVRGSLGENLAFVFLPLILGCMLKISKGNKLFLPILSISFALLVISHNVIAAIFTPIFLFLSLVTFKNKFLPILIAFIFGATSSAFFSVPAIFDLHLVKLSQIKISDISEHLVNLTKLIIPSWGYGPTPNSANPLPTQLGIVSLSIFLSALFLLVIKKLQNRLVVPFLFLYAVAAFLMLKVSWPIWKAVPSADIIQFPWRLLSVIVFSTAILTGYIINFFKNKMLPAIILIAASIISTISYTKPVVFTDKGDGFYATNEDSTTVRDEYLPLWVKEKATTRANEKIIVDTNVAQIKSADIKPASYKVRLSLKEASNVRVNSIYFPTWRIRADGNEIPLSYNNNYGLVEFRLPQGDHEVIINYARSRLHLISEIVSLLSLSVTGAFFFLIWRRQNS